MALLRFLVILIITVTVVKSDLQGNLCDTTYNYTANSTYETNLKELKSYLVSDIISFGFSNYTVGNNTDDMVFGLALCRGDVVGDSCQTCLKSAFREVSKQCPYGRRQILWYEQCFLRYSNTSFFSIRGQEFIHWCSKNNVAHPDKYHLTVSQLMNTLITQAVNNSHQMFAASFMKDASSSNEVYGLVQCTRDLSKDDCYLCLKDLVDAIPTDCYGVLGGKILGSTCNIRYENFVFYNGTTVPDAKPSNKVKRIAIYVGGPVVAALVILLAICAYLRWSRKKCKRNDEDSMRRNVASLLFNISTIKSATNNFSEENKLGEGGFGTVYKGILTNGQDIAVKRLSRNSQQGLEQLRNEVVLLAKLQHNNLVKLLGFCHDKLEKLLVFEYLSNTSLDNFLFDPVKRLTLDWQTRLNIIEGVARGLVYLHEDSRLKIIHRDLKASNILLDEDMNPKISDFGLAKLFHLNSDATHANTSRIAGTYGYMAPEYAMQGQFSTKSDVYSYGVLVLEILTGQTSNYIPNKMDEGLLSFVWRHWKEGEPSEVIDKSVTGHCPSQELIRCIHIGLLCVQEDPSERPNMASVILMLRSPSITMEAPSPPPVFFHSATIADGQTSQTEDYCMATSESVPSTITSTIED